MRNRPSLTRLTWAGLVTPSSSSTPAASRPETPAPDAAAAEPPTPPTAAAAPVAHDIKLELNGGGQRVEVRLTERDGDIHVAVRTPDARLSDAMRADLPALAAKLEQSGFRSDGPVGRCSCRTHR